ncbi:MAG: hypothetical protein ACLUHE_00160 [Christensenellales bacterium]
MTLIASVGVAGTYSPYFETEPPREVREHAANRWPDYEFEDYCEVRGTPKGDYGFGAGASPKRADSRRLS